jgi:hypothetical protein
MDLEFVGLDLVSNRLGARISKDCAASREVRPYGTDTRYAKCGASAAWISRTIFSVVSQPMQPSVMLTP